MLLTWNPHDGYARNGCDFAKEPGKVLVFGKRDVGQFSLVLSDRFLKISLFLSHRFLTNVLHVFLIFSTIYAVYSTFQL